MSMNTTNTDDWNTAFRQVQGVNKTNKPVPDVNHTRGHHIGNSDYSKHRIQPWDIWEAYNLNGWDADIVKRILRTKVDTAMTPTEQRILDYEKIIHNSQERIRQLKSTTSTRTPAD